ncbi:retrovirus-related Pol polyprotein from transposon 17.6 [Trichonephila clavipes]|nr:retrovirus-related Pol polyprotein from transposon 17.6 [Trichonephila clavipes]
MKIGNNGNLVLGPIDESTPCMMIVLMNCQTKLRINHLTAVKSIAILERFIRKRTRICSTHQQTGNTDIPVRFVLARDPINLDESINGALIEEQNVKLNQIANDERSGLSSSQTETSVISALTNKLQEINLRVERLQEASSVTVRKTADLEKAGIISKSNSQYNTPALFVKQREKWRLVLDFRKLNEITLTQDFVIPTLDDILHEISGSNYFSALDMKSAFNQIPLHFADRHKTAFSTTDGDKFEFNRLCFGLKNSPKAFQSIAQEVLGDLLHNGALVYIDDIILFTKTIDEHFELLVADHLSRCINNITIALPDSKDLIKMQHEDPIIQKIDQNDFSPQVSNYFINGEGLLCHLSKRPSRSPRKCRDIRLSYTYEKNSDAPQNKYEYVEKLLPSLEKIFNKVLNNLKEQEASHVDLSTRATKQHHYDYKIGSLCFIKTPNIKSNLSPKLRPKFEGPYRVKESFSNVNYRVQHVEQLRKRFNTHANRMIPFITRFSYLHLNNLDDLQPDETEVKGIVPSPRYNLRARAGNSAH